MLSAVSAVTGPAASAACVSSCARSAQLPCEPARSPDPSRMSCPTVSARAPSRSAMCAASVSSCSRTCGSARPRESSTRAVSSEETRVPARSASRNAPSRDSPRASLPAGSRSWRLRPAESPPWTDEVSTLRPVDAPRRFEPRPEPWSARRSSRFSRRFRSSCRRSASRDRVLTGATHVQRAIQARASHARARETGHCAAEPAPSGRGGAPVGEIWSQNGPGPGWGR